MQRKIKSWYFISSFVFYKNHAVFKNLLPQEGKQTHKKAIIVRTYNKMPKVNFLFLNMCQKQNKKNLKIYYL